MYEFYRYRKPKLFTYNQFTNICVPLSLLQEYIPTTRAQYGVNSLVNGSEYYRACLKWHLSFDMTPEEVHRTGLEEVERIHGEMKLVIYIYATYM